MRDLNSITTANDKVFAEAQGWTVREVSDTITRFYPTDRDGDTYGIYEIENEAWSCAARLAETRIRLDREYQKTREETMDAIKKSRAQPPLKTYSVIGRYFDNGQVFHDAVSASDAKDAIRKSEETRQPDHPYSGSCPEVRDWEVIAVLLGDRIEDVTPAEYVG